MPSKVSHGLVGVLLMLSGATESAYATTTFRAQLWDGTTWKNHLVVNPAVSPAVIVRYTVSYTGTLAPTAFSGINFQPVVTNWTSADAIDFGSSTGNYASVEPRVSGSFETGGPFGRPAAFAYSSIATENALTPFVNTIAGVPTLRLAQAPYTIPPALDSRRKPTYIGGGVPITQIIELPVGVSAPSRPASAMGIEDVPLFGFKLTLGASSQDRNSADGTADLMVGILDFFHINSGAWWYRPGAEWSISMVESRSSMVFESATIDIVNTTIPTPGVGGVGGLVMLRLMARARRRR